MFPSSPWQTLSEGAERIGVPLTVDQIAHFQQYTDLLLTANAQFNLTALRDLPDLITKFHLESLSLIPPLARAVGLSPAGVRQQPWRAADVGAGGGAPGIPLLLAWPALRLTLIESVQKKCTFLRQTLQTLGLPGQALGERVEILAQQPAHRGQYDLVTARAVAPLVTLVELTLPLLRRQGLAALPKGPGVYEELEAAKYAIAQLGGELVGVDTLTIPGVAETRTLVLIRKHHPTPAAYPRRPGLPTQHPLAPPSRHTKEKGQS